MSNVYLKDIPSAGHLYGVTMQKVPQILSQKQEKSQKVMFLPSKSNKTAHIEKKSTELSPWSCPQLNI